MIILHATPSSKTSSSQEPLVQPAMSTGLATKVSQGSGCHGQLCTRLPVVANQRAKTWFLVYKFHVSRCMTTITEVKIVRSVPSEALHS